MATPPGLTAVALEVRARDELIARLAHEARTPIGAILTWLELLKAHAATSPQASRAIEMAERSARELTEIVTGAEEAQRLMAGTVELQMTPLDLPSLLRSAVERALPGAQARNIALDCETPPEGQSTRGDGARLRHAFTRLLIQCVSLSGPGRVQVRLEDERGGIRVDLVCPALTLSDSLRHALQDERAWPSIAGPHGQSVLDFALACRVVGLHGGKLEAKSLNGCGTRISATLPLALAPAD
jgi:signal transduction histidine kinase